MRVLFVENKLKTRFWEAVASQFLEEGAVVGWLVQNPIVRPRMGTILQLPLPNRSQLEQPKDGPLRELLRKADRGPRFFSGIDRHYRHYADRIEGHLAEFQPDLVIGEATLFHELITLHLARERSIPYFHPSTCRYPKGRFSIYLYDTLQPVAGSGDVAEDALLDQMIDRITDGKVRPDYVRSFNGFERLRLRRRLTANALFGIRSRIAGERYNTPSVARKYQLGRRLKANIAHWEKLAHSRGEDWPAQTVLYPLQMQPEANLDVWGAPHADQVGVVRQLLEGLPPDYRVAIKPNPTSKYEMSEALLELVQRQSRLMPIGHERTMSDVIDRVEAVFSVTGTINLECLLTGKPCFATNMPLVAQVAPERLVDSPIDVGRALIERRIDPTQARRQGRELISTLLATSYEGNIGDPVWAPACLADDNVGMVFSGICHASRTFQGTGLRYLDSPVGSIGPFDGKGHVKLDTP